MSREWRAYHPELPDQADARIELSAEEAHHVHRVLRRGPGDRLSVFDGQGAEWAGVIETADRRHVVVRLQRRVGETIESPLEVVLYQGQCRPERMEWVVQKATELGVAAIHPLRTERAEARASDPARLVRWRRIAVEACKQSGRRRLPRVEPVQDLPQLVDTGTCGILLEPGPASAPLGCLLDGARPPRVALAVGPEAGFSNAERATWLAAGWRTGGLGPRTLRTETAGIVAAAIVLHHWGDLGAGER